MLAIEQASDASGLYIAREKSATKLVESPPPPPRAVMRMTKPTDSSDWSLQSCSELTTLDSSLFSLTETLTTKSADQIISVRFCLVLILGSSHSLGRREFVSLRG